MNKLIGKILQLTESKNCTQNLRYLTFCVSCANLVPFAGLITSIMLTNNPTKNHLARNMQILQVFFLQDMQDLALNLAHIMASYMVLFKHWKVVHIKQVQHFNPNPKTFIWL